MKIILTILLLALIVIPHVKAVLGVDVSQLYSISNYECLKKVGYNFAIIRGFCSYGGPDHNAVQSLKNAKAAGL
jgi:hypothetical protein